MSFEHMRMRSLAMRRYVVLVLLLVVAKPSFAHGAQLLIMFFAFLFYAVPAVALVVVPWHGWWARLPTVLVLAVGVAYLWSTVFPLVAPAVCRRCRSRSSC